MQQRLRCKVADLKLLAERYAYQSNEIDLSEYWPGVVKRGYLTKDELRAVARWKSPRSAGRMESNTEDYVQDSGDWRQLFFPFGDDYFSRFPAFLIPFRFFDCSSR